MDKQEYKILSEEIMTLVANEQFPEAAEIADRIDWRKVRSYSMLQKISDLYQLICGSADTNHLFFVTCC
ncbi:MAG TPA: hypothetical protein PLQ04_09675, partial [Lachnospiraceae bacterium]|nr:hypothetical protein [Lachnospiraceae bacterium]